MASQLAVNRKGLSAARKLYKKWEERGILCYRGSAIGGDCAVDTERWRLQRFTQLAARSVGAVHRWGPVGGSWSQWRRGRRRRRQQLLLPASFCRCCECVLVCVYVGMCIFVCACLMRQWHLQQEQQLRRHFLLVRQTHSDNSVQIFELL